MSNPKLSRRFSDLDRRLTQLNKNLIGSFKNRNVSDLTKRQMDLARGFRVLCHAEFEAYFEDRATEMLSGARRKWNESQKVSTTIAALFAHYEKIETKQTLSSKVNQICIGFERDRIKKNHGIKEDNIYKLFIPLGLEKDDFDSTWLSTLDSYGENRGNTAHTAARTQQPIDVTTELSTINLILNGLKDFDVFINKKIKQ